MKTIQLNWKQILFWGSLWGVIEATLGWGLHLIHFKGEALLLYPFGLYCMMQAVRYSEGRIGAAWGVAAVAALVKLVNLFIWPQVPAYWVINPAVAILLEGGVLVGFLAYPTSRWKEQWVVSFLLVLASMVVFRSWQTAMDVWTVSNPDVMRGLSWELIGGWVWKAALQGGYVTCIYRWVSHQPLISGRIHWMERLSYPLFVLSVVLTLWMH